MTWGGARAGAGRPPKGPRSSEPHKRRPLLSPRHPVRVVARVVPGVGTLRRRRAYQAVRRALITSLGRADFRIVHLSIRRSRLELIVEAVDQLALARGMQGFQVSAARALNRAAARSGTVFPDRYRMGILRTRVAVATALAALPDLRRVAWPETWLLELEVLIIPRWRWLPGAT